MNKYPDYFMMKLNSIKSKRPKTVINHIIKYGFITTQELKDKYGYNHPPRAIRDVRERGIPIETYTVTGSDGRKIAAYKFGNPENITANLVKHSGRTLLSKTLKSVLIEKYGSICFIYREKLDAAMLQIDHRVPYEIGGEREEFNIDNFMLLSPSANRAKSWSCEHCVNWEDKNVELCMKCFWSYPENYEHISGRYERVINLYFSGDELEDYNRLISLSGRRTPQEVIKEAIHDYLNKK